MANPTNYSVLFIAFFLIATTSVSNCLLLFGRDITQLQVIGRGLTCSNPSPLLFRPALTSATATLSCDRNLTPINSTTTDAAGDFTIVVSNVTSISSLFFPFNCNVFITVPANCTIIRFFQRVTTLRSLGLIPTRIEDLPSGQALLLQARLFIASM